MGGILHRRRGFTLIELLVIVAIIGIMLGAAVMSVGSGSASAQMKSATRRVLQLSRQARTMALLRQQAAVITYEEIYDGQTLVGGKVTIESKGDAAPQTASGGGQPLTLSGEIPEENGEPLVVSPGNSSLYYHPIHQLLCKTSFANTITLDNGDQISDRKHQVRFTVPAEDEEKIISSCTLNSAYEQKMKNLTRTFIFLKKSQS